MSYRIELLPQPRQALARLPHNIASRLVAAIEGLAEEPRPPGCVKLKGTPNAYRIRIGDYRVVYAIHDDRLVVLVIRVAHRKDVYRNLR